MLTCQQFSETLIYIFKDDLISKQA